MKSILSLRTLTFIFFISMLFSACQKDVGVQDIINLQPEFELMINQSLSEEGGEPSLLIRTIDEQECSNSYIAYQKILGDAGLTLRLNSVGQEGACEKENVIIEEDVILDFSTGTQPLVVSLRDIVSNDGFISSDILKINLELLSS